MYYNKTQIRIFIIHQLLYQKDYLTYKLNDFLKMTVKVIVLYCDPGEIKVSFKSKAIDI